ncbi:hypothetical protein M501DRAFT_1002093 [Patellaria atrata CBS 101060]|uniref:Uncharacterized protein n=1 Tax=Patellaria atrata CBS 101060 TaxID=1346257 RepID=A0A9P4SDY2_9PEZI|nr:hypothetical protein M501DRAFT_1002093 [Patellaria atrata CBS 101060]
MAKLRVIIYTTTVFERVNSTTKQCVTATSCKNMQTTSEGKEGTPLGRTAGGTRDRESRDPDIGRLVALVAVNDQRPERPECRYTKLTMEDRNI